MWSHLWLHRQDRMALIGGRREYIRVGSSAASLRRTRPDECSPTLATVFV